MSITFIQTPDLPCAVALLRRGPRMVVRYLPGWRAEAELAAEAAAL